MGTRPADRTAAARGVTIIELLVVLTLMAALLGLGISMYTNLGRQGVFTASAVRVLSTLNRVRNSSMTHAAGLQVNAGDPQKGQENSVRGVEFITMCSTQCEPPGQGEPDLQGALDRNGILPPGAVFKEGVIGKGLFLEGGGAVDFGNHPAYDATEGVSVDVWVYPANNGGGTLVHRGEGLGLYLVRQGEGLTVRFELAFAAGPVTPGGAKPESAIVETRRFEPRGLEIPVKKWSRIVASYDRFFVTVAVDTGRGPVEKLRERETQPLAPSRTTSLYVGGGGGQGASFRGGIDDLRIEGVLGEAYEPFPPQVLVDGPTRRIRFAAGKLDPAYHTRPEVLVLRYGRRERKIVIGLEGNVTDK